MSNIGTAVSSIVGMMQIAKGAIEARDWTKLSEMSAKFNDQIVKTQQAVIDAQSAQSDLIGQLTDAHQKIRELQATIAEQARHSLEEITAGQFALRIQDTLDGAKTLGLSGNSKTQKYACQPCFALLGKSIVLRLEPESEWYPARYACPHCKTEIFVR